MISGKSRDKRVQDFKDWPTSSKEVSSSSSGPDKDHLGFFRSPQIRTGFFESTRFVLCLSCGCDKDELLYIC
jgi:hypothetical protein